MAALHRVEDYADAFQRAAHKLIAVAAAADDRVGRHIHVDATHFTTHGRLIHCCPDPHACAGLWAAQGGGAKPKKVLTKATDEPIKAERHRAQAQPEPAPGTRPMQLASVALDDSRLDGFTEDELQRHAFFELRAISTRRAT